MQLRFWKVEAVGNDFVLVLLEDVAAMASDVEAFLPKLAAFACPRHFGIGSDGLLVLSRDGPNLVQRMFNPDGTEDFCGNGLRASAEFARQQGWVSNTFSMRHLDRNVAVELLADGQIKTNLGLADYSPDKVPVRSGRPLFKESIFSGMVDGQPMNLFGSALTTGSTHVVIPVASLPDFHTFKTVSPAIETANQYPKSTSVIWVKEVGAKELQIRIWERGVGETQGCGTGSAAAAADYMRRRSLGGPVTVHNPGGDVTVIAEAWDQNISLMSSAQVLYQGMLDIRPLVEQMAIPGGRLL